MPKPHRADDFSTSAGYMNPLIVFPVFLAFGIPCWLFIYLQTYRHFPRMEPKKRVQHSIANATILTSFVLVLTFLTWYYLIQNLG